MEYEFARTELARHAGCAEEFYDDGFIGSLRPYAGLRDPNFHCVVEALLSAGSTFSARTNVERSIAEAVLRITVRARQIGIDDNGMLVRNGLITPDDRSRLRDWVEIIEDMAIGLFAGRHPYDTIHGYCEYVAEFGWGENSEFFLPLLSAAIDNDEVGDGLQSYCAAIIKLGSDASSITDCLIRAKERNWKWYKPHERCSEEMVGYIRDAIAATEKGRE